MKRKKPIVKIRTDATHEIGLGHVVRCISLAHMLKNDFTIHFFALKIPGSFNNEIIHNQWEHTTIENESDFFNSLSGDEIVVLDGYHFDSEYQKKIKSKGCKLVSIDDVHDQYFYADLVINHAPGVSTDDYKGEKYTKYLLGPDYALLRPAFLETKSHKKKNAFKGIKKIFICFGGSDSKNLTANILSWLPTNNYSVTVVLGNAYSHQDALNKVIEKREDLEILVKNSLSAEEMRNEFLRANLAIVPTSGISMEASVTGTPSIIGHYTANQVPIYNGLVDKKGFYDAIDFSRDNFTAAFKTAEESYQPPEIVYPSDISKRLNDEFIKLKYQNELKLREATEDDIDVLFDWANDPLARKNSYDQEKIDYSSHVTWVQNKLNSTDCVFLMFENEEDQQVGFVRFDRDKQNKWVLSINIAPSQRGYGYSIEILRRALIHFSKIKGKVAVEAFIKKENIASIKAFERAGFEFQTDLNIKGEESLLMVREEKILGMAVKTKSSPSCQK